MAETNLVVSPVATPPAQMTAPSIQVEEVDIIETDPEVVSDERFKETPIIIGSSMDAERCIWAIKRCERTIERLVKQRQDAEMFYVSRIEGQKMRIGVLKDILQSFMKNNELKSIQLPSGTVSLKKSEKVQYDEEATPALLAWAKENLPEAVAVEERILKDVLKAGIKKTGELPPGISFSTPDTVVIRKR